MVSKTRFLTLLVASGALLTATTVAAGAATASTHAPAAGAVHATVLPASGLHRAAAGTQVSSGIIASLFAAGPAPSASPDDITTLGGDIFVAYQNGVGPNGEAATDGTRDSTLVEYHADGYLAASWSLAGKIDGLTADPANSRLVATVNEDGNSSLYAIHPFRPAASQVVHLTYTPALSPTLSWGGGTDAPRIFNGNLYISASAPSFANTPPVVNPGPAPALISVTLDESTGHASWIPAFVATRTATQLGTDPDSNNVVPASAAAFGGDFVLVSQGDGQLYFIANPNNPSNLAPSATATPLQLPTQIDDIEFATADTGTLYVVDGASNNIVAFSGSFTPGTAFVALPDDSTVPGVVGELDLATGDITPVVLGLKSPKGLLFVPGPPALGPYGYRLAAGDGGTFNFGDSTQLGTLGNVKLNKPVVGSTTTPDRLGQYLVASDGGVFAFGDAPFLGSLGATGSPSPIVGIAYSSTAGGYWLAAADGTVTPFGSVTAFGSVVTPRSPIVAITATAGGGGYWLTTATGKVYPFGDAENFGDISGQPLNGPIVGMAATPDGGGYWLTASDGGVFSFGDAVFYGSAGGIKLNKPVVAIVPTNSGGGYWLVATDGGVFSYGDAAFFGSTGGLKLNRPIVGASS